MKATLLQENLQQSLGTLQKAIPSRPQLPVLAAILITASEDTLTIAATDLYFGVTARVAATVSEPGTVAVPGKEFREVISSLPPGELTIQLSENTLSISSQHSKTKLQCLESSEYPAFPTSEGTRKTLSKEVIDAVSEYVLFSASTDVARPLLTGVLFSFSEEKLEIVGTDGFRLSVLHVPITSEEAYSFIMPAKTVSEMSRIMSQLSVSEAVFSVSESLKQVYISLPGVEMFSRLLDGAYPPYQKIMPTSFTTEVTMSAAELLEQVKRASIFSRDTSSIVQLTITAETVSLTAASSVLGTFAGELATAQITGSGGQIAFKTKYLQDFLQVVKQDEIWFGMSDSLKPALFKSPLAAGLQYVVMPFRVTT